MFTSGLPVSLSRKFRLRACLAFFGSWLFCGFFCASECLAERIVVESVELKDDADNWHMILKPDRLVDLAKEEPRFSFFNQHRIPPGSYVNFRVRYANSNHEHRLLTSCEDIKGISLKQGSFVGVQFSFGGDSNFKKPSSLILNVDDLEFKKEGKSLCG